MSETLADDLTARYQQACANFAFKCPTTIKKPVLKQI